MQTAKEAREARRKRILERGSDRLAYITGDTSKQHAVKVSPIPSPQGGSSFTVQSTAADIGSSFDDNQTVEDFQERVSGPPPAQASASEPSPTMQPLALSSRVSEEPRVTPSPIAPTSSDLLPTRKATKKLHTTYVTSIVRSIEASEVFRASTAAFVAVLVVMQSVLLCCGHPWGDMLAIFLPRWPLILVCITDLTLVVGAFTFHSQNRNSQKTLGGSSSSEGLDGSFDKISKALDVVGQFEDLLNLGLLFKKAAGAITLDCSIYAVTLVCGFSMCDYMFSCCRGYRGLR